MKEVFFYEAFDEEEAALRQFMPPGIAAGFTPDTIQEAGHLKPPARLISVRTQSSLPVDWAPGLDAVLSRSTGYDHLSRYRCETRGEMALGYLPLYCRRAVAEQAMVLWSSLLRKMPQQLRQFDTYCRDGLTGRECRRRCLVIAGVGNIGYQAAVIGRGLEMEVLGVDPVRRFEDIEYVPPDDAWPRADVVLCSMNLTDDNLGCFNKSVFDKLRPGAVFVNVARGELAITEDVIAALESGRLAGFGADVLQDENELAAALRGGRIAPGAPAAKSLERLRRHPNVLLTPHNAFNTEEAVSEKSRQSAEQVQSFLSKGKFVWSVPA